MGALLRAYAGPASQHSLQLSFCSESDADAYDNKLKAVWEALADRRLDEQAVLRLGLPVRLGGARVQWASTRRSAAYWAGWTAVATDVRLDVGAATLADLMERLPGAKTQLEQARASLASQGALPSDGAALGDALDKHLKQGVYTITVQKKLQSAHMVDMASRDNGQRLKASLLGAGGPGGGAFLHYPEDANCSMEDVHFSTALRQRLGLLRAECSQAELAAATALCQLCRADGAVCRAVLDDDGFHSLICQYGGGVLRRHRGLQDAVCGLIRRWMSQTPFKEQRVPRWDRPAAGDQPVQRAVLDIEYTEGGQRHWIDVSVRHSAAGAPALVHVAARRAGEAARRGERDKHQRYEGTDLTAFVIETFGYVGLEARQWLRQHAQNLDDDVQSSELSRAYKVISCAVQTEMARQLRKAAGLK